MQQNMKWRAARNPVYTIQPVVKPVVKRVWQPVECLYTRYNQLSNRFDNRLYRVNGSRSHCSQWTLYPLMAYCCWASSCTQSNASFLERTLSSTRVMKDRYSTFSDQTQWLSSMCVVGSSCGVVSSQTGFRIVAATALWWSSLGALRAVWSRNLNREGMKRCVMWSEVAI